ncbi:HAD-IA family hydrolase [Niameybacter massiliensis]|uniref:HAD-IA family hydrolase n=1 Tax=Niameybacter massiliensis TaxID=1658108 RepID=UPI0006B44190|nr:HAD-IA family hydrolase [Niameybacter massiliensis]
MKYKNIIFDLDGTLLNTSQGIFNSVNSSLEKLGYDKLDEEVLSRFVGPPVYDSFMDICKMNSILAEKATNMYRETYWQIGMYEATLYEGIENLLQNLKKRGCKLTVATLKREDQAIAILKQFNLLEYFDTVHGANEAGTLKKHDLIKIACESVNISVDESVMIGDTLHDAKGAEIVGVDFIAVTYGFGFKGNQEIGSCKNVLATNQIKDIQYFLGKMN